MGIGGSHPGAHCCATYFVVGIVLEREVISGEGKLSSAIRKLVVGKEFGGLRDKKYSFAPLAYQVEVVLGVHGDGRGNGLSLE